MQEYFNKMLRVSDEYGVLEASKMQAKMILRLIPHYQCSFKCSTVRVVSFRALQNLELAGRTGNFVN